MEATTNTDQCLKENRVGIWCGVRRNHSSYFMNYLPNNTYTNFPSLVLRYNALLKELCYQSREAQRLRNRVASFDEYESRLAKRKLKRTLDYIIKLREEAK